MTVTRHPALTGSELTRIHPNYETADDKHLERLGPLAEGEQQSGEDGETIVQQQSSLPA